MMQSKHRATPLLAVGLSALLAAGCTSFSLEDKVDYKSAKSGPSLDVPPDLTQLSRENRFAVPGGAVSASSFGAVSAQERASSGTAAAALGDVRFERDGNKRWLVVGQSPEKLWDPVRDFWRDSGFLLTLDQQNLGIMETDWAENRAKLPQDFIRNTIGRVFDSLYSTGERDRFRTRMERSPGGGTEIYISHRGMIEVYGSASKDTTVWQPRPSDSELEAEFLRRLMVRLGASAEQAKALQQAGASKPTSRVARVDNAPVAQIDEGFDRAWRRVGLALDRTGFTVEDRDRAQGIYFVRYVEPNPDKAEKGFLGKLFSGSDKAPAPQKYRIALNSSGDSTVVSVLNASGKPDSSASAQRIVQVIVDDLK